MVGIIPTMHSKDLIRDLKKAGWVEDRAVGSHHIFKHPTIPGHITVPHPKKELGKGLVHKIRRQAGLK
jgi:predicted RNA binding protein YcfA (HicA-like mRNA interferase family)